MCLVSCVLCLVSSSSSSSSSGLVRFVLGEGLLRVVTARHTDDRATVELLHAPFDVVARCRRGAPRAVLILTRVRRFPAARRAVARGRAFGRARSRRRRRGRGGARCAVVATAAHIVRSSRLRGFLAVAVSPRSRAGLAFLVVAGLDSRGVSTSTSPSRRVASRSGAGASSSRWPRTASSSRATPATRSRRSAARTPSSRVRSRSATRASPSSRSASRHAMLRHVMSCHVMSLNVT